MQSTAPAGGAPRVLRGGRLARELASWRVLRMWANGDTLADAVTVKLIGVHEGHSIVVTAPEDEFIAGQGRCDVSIPQLLR